jgi:hypothetical protein
LKAVQAHKPRTARAFTGAAPHAVLTGLVHETKCADTDCRLGVYALVGAIRGDGSRRDRRCVVGKVLLCLAALVQLASIGSATIWIDENFDDGTAFVDLGFPIKNNVATVTASQIAATQGINVRSWHDPGAPAFVAQTSGTVVPNAYYCRGSTPGRCLRLDSGQSVRAGNGTSIFGDAGEFPMVVQFSLRPEPAVNQQLGTRMGYFRINWSADGANNSVELSFQADMVYVGGCGDGYVLRDHGTNSFIAGQHNLFFQVFSIVAIDPTPDPSPFRWGCYDALKAKYKGPQPANPSIFPQDQLSDYPVLLEGVHVFADREADPYRRSFSTLGATPSLEPTHLVSWEIVAENGATLFLDEVGFFGSAFSAGSIQQVPNQDAGARLDDFLADCQPVIDCFAAATDWQLYQ